MFLYSRRELENAGDKEYELGKERFKQQKYAEAEQLFQQSAQQREKVLGAEHEDTLWSKHWIARTLNRQQKYAEAEQLFRQSAQQREKVLGAEHKNTLESKYRLAFTLYKQRKYAEAEQLFRQSAQQHEKVLGAEHENALWSKYQLALTLHKQQKYAEAEEILQQSTQEREKVLGAEHKDTLESKRLLQDQQPEKPDESPDLMFKNENLYIRQLDAHQREIRLLSFAATANPDDSIQLEMCYVSLNDYQYFEYDALSYTWGNPVLEIPRDLPLADCLPQSFITTPIQGNGQNVETRHSILSTIRVNGKQHEVTENLYSALRRLRQIDRKHFLWVDAICINQEDLRERSEQIKLMGDIYRNAKEVLIWLGDESGDTDSGMAVDLLEHLFTSCEDFCEDNVDEGIHEITSQLENDLDAMEPPGAIEYEDIGIGIIAKLGQVMTAWINNTDFFSLPVRCDQRAWDSVAWLLMRSWFWRVWTYQERALAKACTVLVGTKSISWVHLNAATMGIGIHDSLSDKPQVLPRGEYANFVRSSNSSLRVGDQGMNITGRGLLDLVREMQPRQCKDPRDKIYGVLGTAIENDPGFIHIVHMVDYEAVSTQILYTELARFYIQDQGDLRILQSCSFSLQRIEGLPTWVPDWTIFPKGNILASREYRAARESEVIVEHKKDTNEMSFWGVAIDRVKLLAPLACQEEVLLSKGQLLIAKKVFEAFAAVYLAAKMLI